MENIPRPRRDIEGFSPGIRVAQRGGIDGSSHVEWATGPSVNHTDHASDIKSTDTGGNKRRVSSILYGVQLPCK